MDIENLEAIHNNQLKNHASLAENLSGPIENALVLKSGYESWACAWSDDASIFAWSCGDKVVKLMPWNRRNHRVVTEQDKEYCPEAIDRCRKPIKLLCNDLVWSLAFGSSSPTTKANSVYLDWEDNEVQTETLLIATGLSNGRIRIWDAYQGVLLNELCDHRGIIRDLKFAPDGSLRLASASRDGELKLWDLLDGGNLYKTVRAECKWIYSIAWSPDAKMIAVVGDKKSAVIWNIGTYTKKRLSGHHHNVSSCNFSPDGAILATASYDTSVILWDPYTTEPILMFRHLYPPPPLIYAGGHNGAFVRGVSFSRDGRHVATVSDDAYVRFWDIYDTSNPVRTAVVTNALCCNYSPDGQVLAVGTRNGSVSIWRSPMTLSTLQHHCRLTIRRLLPSNHVAKVHLPEKLKQFLLYKNHCPPNNNEELSQGRMSLGGATMV